HRAGRGGSDREWPCGADRGGEDRLRRRPRLAGRRTRRGHRRLRRWAPLRRRAVAADRPAGRRAPRVRGRRGGRRVRGHRGPPGRRGLRRAPEPSRRRRLVSLGAGRRGPRRDDVRRLRRGAPRPRGRRSHVGNRALRRAQPHPRQDAARRDLDARHACAPTYGRVAGLVRPAWRRLDRLRPARPRGGRAPPRRRPPRDRVRHGRAVRLRTRSERRPAGRTLRGLARAHARRAACVARVGGCARASLEARARGRDRMRLVSTEDARRIAVRAQLLDGSATTVLDTVQRLRFLQIDPISTVAPPQQLVLWSRLGPYDVTELDRLLWDEKKLFEWNAFIWPESALPYIRARMRRRRQKYAWERRGNEFLATNARAKRRVLLELERDGPLLSREIADHAVRTFDSAGWWGARKAALMLEILDARGHVAVVGRRNGQRLWDLAERWYPEVEKVALREAETLYAEQRFRALGVRLTNKGWEAHPDASVQPVPDRVTFLSPFDRLVHDRNRAEA